MRTRARLRGFLKGTEKVTIYNEKNTGDYRWRRQSANGRFISGCLEGYKNHSHAVKMAHHCNQPGLLGPTIVFEDLTQEGKS